jgi:excisionase family DNA binding protein
VTASVVPSGASTPAPHLEPAYMTVAQVAELLQVAEPTIYAWTRKLPDMPCVRLAGTVRFPRARLLEWLRSREQGRPPIRKRVPASDQGRANA